MRAQIHWAVFVEIDTETGDVSEPKIDSEASVGDTDGPVWLPESETWVKGYELPDALYDAAWKRLSENFEPRELTEVLNGLALEVWSRWGVTDIEAYGVKASVNYVEPQDSKEPELGAYAEIRIVPPGGVCGVIEGDTFGRLGALRIYERDS